MTPTELRMDDCLREIEFLRTDVALGISINQERLLELVETVLSITGNSGREAIAENEKDILAKYKNLVDAKEALGRAMRALDCL